MRPELMRTRGAGDRARNCTQTREAGANVALVDLGNPSDAALTYNLSAHTDLVEAAEAVKARGVKVATILADVTRFADCERAGDYGGKCV